MKVVFLDIDGVLVTKMTLQERLSSELVCNPLCVSHLNYVTRLSQAKLVLSSSWRFCGINEMKLILKFWGVSAELVGATPDHTRRLPSGEYVAPPRSMEIQEWLDNNLTVTSFVIFDDDCLMEHLNHKLIRTESELGITSENANQALGILAEI